MKARFSRKYDYQMNEMDTIPLHKILVVDDENMICEVVYSILAYEGYGCETANSVDEALVKLADEDYSLVISDINMPGKTGIDLLNTIKVLYPDLGVIMATGVNDRDVGINTLEKGAYAYLIKPFSRNELLINVSNAIRKNELEINNRRYHKAIIVMQDLGGHHFDKQVLAVFFKSMDEILKMKTRFSDRPTQLNNKVNNKFL